MVTVVEGSATETGTIQILTRGITQTAETLTLATGERSVIYSNGDAKEGLAGQFQNPPLELIVTDQSVLFPLPFLAGLVANTDETFSLLSDPTRTAFRSSAMAPASRRS
jgi:hypothetical protein